MMGPWRSLRNLHITARLVFWFLVIALIPVTALTLITYFLSVTFARTHRTATVDLDPRRQG